MLRQAGILTAVVILASCSQTAEKIETAANRSTTSWAMGKPYSQVAALGNSALDQLAVDQTGYGQMIGSSTLSDGSTLYRHIAPAAETTTDSSFGGLVGTNKSVTNYRLSYFKVGQDNVVRDWATGKASSSISSCVSYIAGIFQKCTEQSRVRQTLAVYDSLVMTSTNTPISNWGTIIPPADIVTVQ